MPLKLGVRGSSRSQYFRQLLPPNSMTSRKKVGLAICTEIHLDQSRDVVRLIRHLEELPTSPRDISVESDLIISMKKDSCGSFKKEPESCALTSLLWNFKRLKRSEWSEY